MVDSQKTPPEDSQSSDVTGKGYWGFPFKRRTYAEHPLWLRVLMVVFLLMMLIPALLAGLLSTEALSRWAFQQADARLEALELDFESGNFWRGWHFGHVSWKSEALVLNIDRLEMNWKPSCLLTRRLCIDRLYSHRVTFIVPETGESDSAPFELPDIRLPLALDLGDVTLDELSLDGETTLLSELHLQTRSGNGKLMVREFSGRGPDLSWRVQGDVRTQGQWPLNLTGELQLPPVDEREWRLKIVASGNLEAVQLDVASEGYLTGRLNGQLAPFEPGVPASARWKGETFLPYQELPETLTLDNWTLTAKGDFDTGFAVTGRSSLPLAKAGKPDGGSNPEARIELSLTGRLTTSEATDIRARLSVADATSVASAAASTSATSEPPARTALLSGDVSWQDALDVKARLNVQHFPWQRLYPLEVGVAELKTLDATARWGNGQLDGELAATVKGVSQTVSGQVRSSPIVSLDARVKGDTQALDVSSLRVSTEAGWAEGGVALDFASGLQWDGELRLQDLNPGVLIKSLPGQLSGNLSSQGQLQGDQLTLSSRWDLDGTLRNEPLVLEGSLNKPADTWTLSNFQMRQGENYLDGSGQWGTSVSGNFDVQLNRLQSLWLLDGPAPRGQVRGKVSLSGSAQAPSVAMQLNGEALEYGDLRTAAVSLQGNVRLDDSVASELTLTAEDVRQGSVQLGNADLSLGGDRSDHQLQLDVTDGVVDVATRLRGSLTDQHWQGQLSRSAVTLGQQVWQLQDQATLKYQLDGGELNLSGHCWQHQSASLCFNREQTLMPDRKLDLALNQFDLSTLSKEQDVPWMPEDLSWEGLLDASLKMTQATGQAPIADVHVTTANGVIRLREPVASGGVGTRGNAPESNEPGFNQPGFNQPESDEVQWEIHDFPYQQLELSTRLEADVATTQAQIASEALGLLDIEATVRDPGGQQQVDGHYRLSGFKLNVLRPFIPQVDRLEGELNGQGEIRGLLRKPDIGGQLRLRDGHISGVGLPVSFEDMSADIEIAGQTAKVNGEWASGEQGKGKLEGNVSWAPWGGELKFTGQRLPASVPPYASLYLSPDLTLSLRNNALSVTGSVAIPDGQVTVHELEKEAVQLSPDAVIVGQEKTQDTVPLGITARVRLDVGDQVHLSAFGLKGRLSGQLDVRENMTASGDLRLLDGTFNRLGQDLKLRRAILLFSGPISKPYLNVEAIREVDDVVAGLRITGRARNPESEVFSEPAMSQQEALSYLILGHGIETDEDTGEDSNLMAQAAVSVGVAGTAPYTQKVAASLGLKDFELETEGVGNATQVVASGSITDKLSLRYGVGVFDSSSEVGVRYDLTKRLYIEAISGFASSLDFFYRIDF
ncbi:translocation/assembly module TamB domain-containing protein [Pseudomaricurvus sp.]|uniref:translocation/assembly module TamB domain-containing protein n=1 Tax=Pseudomaricurvus sp. TaxID=2004510 RepID=UPI003F6BFF70